MTGRHGSEPGSESVCALVCRIDPPHLLWVLEGLLEGEVRNPVRVPEATAREARIALDRMLAIT